MLAPDATLQNRYRIVRQLGQGGMGTVYEAVDERLDTTVALKESHFTDEQLGKQFEREARLLARLRHAAVARVIDHFKENDSQFLVMDFIDGEDLWEMLRGNGRALPISEVLTWADQLLDALVYLHGQEPPVIHRDIKPQNLKLAARNQIILLDFGLAKGFAGQTSRVTTSGSIFGYTPNYAPLEQIQGTGTDPRSDLYSLAATLYHLMTGTAPPDVLTRLTATTDGQPDPLQPAHQVNRKIAIEVEGVLHRAMAIGRTQRFATAAEMRQALREASRFNQVVDGESGEATLLPTMINPAQATRELKPTVKPLPSTTADAITHKPPSAIESTVASPAAESIAAEQETILSFDDPSTQLFEEPVGHIDRFSAVRKAGYFLLAVILLLTVILLISAGRR